MATRWSGMVAKGAQQEFPNKLSLVYNDATQIRRPRDHFPAFYGCFDWHSAVHGHWVLVRCLQEHPQMRDAAKTRSLLKDHLSADNLKREADFFARDENKSFERMYGWAWLLRLAIALQRFDDPDATIMRRALRPLEDVIVKRITAYLPLLTYPIRIGQHTDTGFALGQIYDYAQAMNNPQLAALIRRQAERFYGDDIDYPIHYEPSGHDFFSSAWNTVDLMRRVSDPASFSSWLAGFLPRLQSQLTDGTIAPVSVSDLTDGKLIHLAGLNLHRAWCMRSVWRVLPINDPLRSVLLESARRHLRAGVAYVNSGHYEGDHWLATFALYAITS
ncbi:MAG: DUF2891 domain-containing protein [Planctomycetota bacterium]